MAVFKQLSVSKEDQALMNEATTEKPKVHNSSTQTIYAQQRKKGRGWILSSFWVLLLSLVVIATYVLVWPQFKDLKQEANQLRSQLVSLQQELVQLTELTHKHDQSNRNIQAQYRNTTENLQLLLSKLATIEEKVNTHDSQLESNDYQELVKILDLAFKKLNLEQDALGTTQLLDQAMQRYCTSVEPSTLAPLCLAIEKDRALLIHTPHPNLGRIVEEVTLLQKNLDNLLIAPKKRLQLESKSIDNSDFGFSEMSSWSERIRLALARMAEFISNHVVKIHKLSQDAPLVLVTEQRIFLIRNTQLLLEQVKVSALTKNQEIYDLTLKESQRALRLYLPDSKFLTQQLHQLTSLQNVVLIPELPKLSNTFEALQLIKRDSKEYDIKTNENTANTSAISPIPPTLPPTQSKPNFENVIEHNTL